jgi:hypothetical protein
LLLQEEAVASSLLPLPLLQQLPIILIFITEVNKF